jgi:hypothetical protein
MAFNKEIASANLDGFREGEKYGREQAIRELSYAIIRELLNLSKPIDPMDTVLAVMAGRESILKKKDIPEPSLANFNPLPWKTCDKCRETSDGDIVKWACPTTGKCTRRDNRDEIYDNPEPVVEKPEPIKWKEVNTPLGKSLMAENLVLPPDPVPEKDWEIMGECSRCGFSGRLNFEIVMLNGTHQCRDKAGCFERMGEKGVPFPAAHEYSCYNCWHKGELGIELQLIGVRCECIDKKACAEREKYNAELNNKPPSYWNNRLHG